MCFLALLTVGGGVGAALMRVVQDVADTERLPKWGAIGAMNALAADVKRARIARAEKRAISSLSLGAAAKLLVAVLFYVWG